jgi:hypothetical protein
VLMSDSHRLLIIHSPYTMKRKINQLKTDVETTKALIIILTIFHILEELCYVKYFEK